MPESLVSIAYIAAGLLFIGVLLLWAIAGLAKALIGAGVRLLASLAPGK